VVGGAILSFFALLEFNTGYNVFDHMNRFFPLLRLENTGFHDLEVRGGKARVYGSSQHPIAYGAMLTMLVPLAIYLARRTRTRFWWSAAGLLVLGSLATISRTGIVMIIVILIMYARTFPKFVRRLWPLLVPAILVIHFALPGSLGTLWGSFFPKGGIVSQQEAGAGTRGSGRLADLGPGLAEAMQTPLLGQGYSTRVVDETSPLQNAPILDDQWLGTLLETGILGMAAWLWLFVGFTRRMMRRAREDVDSPDAWLYAALGSAVASFAWGMAFYDAFAFIQVTFVALLLITLGGLLLTQEPLRARAPAPAPAR
jgi:O-antigen ligase